MIQSIYPTRTAFKSSRREKETTGKDRSAGPRVRARYRSNITAGHASFALLECNFKVFDIASPALGMSPLKLVRTSTNIQPV